MHGSEPSPLQLEGYSYVTRCSRRDARSQHGALSTTDACGCARASTVPAASAPVTRRSSGDRGPSARRRRTTRAPAAAGCRPQGLQHPRLERGSLPRSPTPPPRRRVSTRRHRVLTAAPKRRRHLDGQVLRQRRRAPTSAAVERRRVPPRTGTVITGSPPAAPARADLDAVLVEQRHAVGHPVRPRPAPGDDQRDPQPVRPGPRAPRRTHPGTVEDRCPRARPCPPAAATFPSCCGDRRRSPQPESTTVPVTSHLTPASTVERQDGSRAAPATPTPATNATARHAAAPTTRCRRDRHRRRMPARSADRAARRRRPAATAAPAADAEHQRPAVARQRRSAVRARPARRSAGRRRGPGAGRAATPAGRGGGLGHRPAGRPSGVERRLGTELGHVTGADGEHEVPGPRQAGDARAARDRSRDDTRSRRRSHPLGDQRARRRPGPGPRGPRRRRVTTTSVGESPGRRAKSAREDPGAGVQVRLEERRRPGRRRRPPRAAPSSAATSVGWWA